MKKSTRFQIIRIAVLLLITAIGFVIYDYWYYRTITIQDLPVYARMKRSGFAGKKLAFLPMGNVDKEEIQVVADFFSELYDLDVEVLPLASLPKNCYLDSGKQYDGVAINQFLAKQRENNYYKMVGIINEDMTAGPYNFVFGVSSLGNHVGTISLTRLREEFYQRPANPQLFNKRLIKIVLHEYGHTFGLGHCTGDGPCLMKFINSTRELDLFPCGFCWVCNSRVLPD